MNLLVQRNLLHRMTVNSSHEFWASLSSLIFQCYFIVFGFEELGSLKLRLDLLYFKYDVEDDLIHLSFETFHFGLVRFLCGHQQYLRMQRCQQPQW